MKKFYVFLSVAFGLAKYLSGVLVFVYILIFFTRKTEDEFSKALFFLILFLILFAVFFNAEKYFWKNKSLKSGEEQNIKSSS